MQKHFEYIKEMSDMLAQTENKRIQYGSFNDDGKITDDMVRLMIQDIIYTIFLNDFDSVLKMNWESVASVAQLFSAHIPQRANIWHSLYVLNTYKNRDSLPAKYNKIHQELYYKLGGSHRDFLMLNDLLQIVSLNCMPCPSP